MKSWIDEYIKNPAGFAEYVADRMRASMNDFMANPGKYAPKHRAGIDDMQWAKMQPKREDAAFYPTDVVRCKESGNLCMIEKRSEDAVAGGWPVQYSVTSLPGQGRPSRCAWYYDLDLELVEPGPFRKYLQKEATA